MGWEQPSPAGPPRSGTGISPDRTVAILIYRPTVGPSTVSGRPGVIDRRNGNCSAKHVASIFLTRTAKASGLGIPQKPTRNSSDTQIAIAHGRRTPHDHPARSGSQFGVIALLQFILRPKGPTWKGIAISSAQDVAGSLARQKRPPVPQNEIEIAVTQVLQSRSPRPSRC